MAESTRPNRVQDAMVLVAILAFLGAMLWIVLDNSHQDTVRACLKQGKAASECARFSEVP